MSHSWTGYIFSSKGGFPRAILSSRPRQAHTGGAWSTQGLGSRSRCHHEKCCLLTHRRLGTGQGQEISRDLTLKHLFLTEQYSRVFMTRDLRGSTTRLETNAPDPASGSCYAHPRPRARPHQQMHQDAPRQVTEARSWQEMFA